MNSPRLTIVLAVLLVVVLKLVVIERPDATQLNWEFFPEMKHSPSRTAFEATTLFPNGRVQQSAVAGTIPRGQMPLHYTATKENALRAGDELLNPYQQKRATPPPDGADAAPSDPQAELAASTERGEGLYRIYCQCCHGQGGAGDGPVAQRGFPPPPPLPTGKSAQMKDGQLFHILSYGQGSMSSMSAQLDRGQRWDVINFVRSMQSKAAAAQPATPAGVNATPSEDTPAKP